MSEGIKSKFINSIRNPFLVAELGIVTIFILYIFFRQYQMFYTLQFPDFDLSIPHQGIYLMSSFHDPFVTIRGLHVFGDHVSLTNLFFIPIYWIFPSPFVLLFAGTAALGISGFLIYLIAKKQLKSEAWGLFLSAVFLLYPALHYLSLIGGYYPVVFAVPFVLLFWLSYLHDNKILGLISCFLLLMVQEDIALVLIGLCIYLYFFKKWKPAGRFLIIGIVYLILVLFVLIPYFSESNGYQYQGRTIGSLVDVLKGDIPIKHYINHDIITEKNKEYLLGLFEPISFLVIINPLPIILNPMIWVNLLSDWPYQHEIIYHYTAAIIGVIFISLIGAISFLTNLPKKKRTKTNISAIIVIALVLTTIFGNSYAHDFMKFDNIHEKGPEFDKGFLAEIDRLNMITKGESLSSSNSIIHFFSTRYEIYLWPNPLWQAYYGIPDKEYCFKSYPKYIVLYKNNIGLDIMPFELLKKRGYVLVSNKEDLLLYQKIDGIYLVSNRLYGSARLYSNA